jgi:hypothetical protein
VLGSHLAAPIRETPWRVREERPESTVRQRVELDGGGRRLRLPEQPTEELPDGQPLGLSEADRPVSNGGRNAAGELYPLSLPVSTMTEHVVSKV